MRHENVIDPSKFFPREIAHAGPPIDQNVVIDQKGCGAMRTTNSSAAAQDPEFHVALMTRLTLLSQETSADRELVAVTPDTTWQRLTGRPASSSRKPIIRVAA